MALLRNASSLRHDETLKEWIDTASIVVAREVFVEPSSTQDHAVRLELANAVSSNAQVVRDKMIVSIAGDPTLAGTGAAPPALDDAAETVILGRVRSSWTIVAKVWKNIA